MGSGDNGMRIEGGMGIGDMLRTGLGVVVWSMGIKGGGGREEFGGWW